MGMSTHVVGLTSEDEPIYQKNLEVYNVCVKNEINVPDEVNDYFNNEKPECKLEVELPVEEWGDDYRKGYELLVADIPKGVSKIRFYNSY